MTKTSRNLASAAEESFHKHYAAIWGQERWQDSLYPALTEPTRYAALLNRYAPFADFWRLDIARDSLEQLDFPQIEASETSGQKRLHCFARKPKAASEDETSKETLPEAPFPQPTPAGSHSAHLMTHWNLDAASVLVASLLDVQPGDSVLDLCAAPGGKSIALAQRMWPTFYADPENDAPAADASSVKLGKLCSNEADERRQKRLAENLQAYLPPQLVKQGHVRTTRVDASEAGPQLNALIAQGGCDKVLVDAPCSSERHIIHAHTKTRASGNAAPEMTNWRPGSSKRLAKTQVELAMTALRLAKVGGTVVYATCSIETAENDGVIEKVVATVEKERKRGGRWSVKLGLSGDDAEGERVGAQLEKWAERTKYGWIVLPDHSGGGRWGPLFFAVMTKVPAGTV